jgi:glycosyltransferase involved in cell wall biosynthesis
MNHKAEIAALIPAYNAARSLSAVITGVKGHGLPVVVVDDGSGDATVEVARAAGAEVLRHPANRGKGTALRTGFWFIVEQGYRAVITIDADGQHDPSYIPTFIRAFEQAEGEIIIGSRAGEFGGMSWLRRFWNKLGVRAVSKMIGTPLTDTQSGYRLIACTVLQGLPLRAAGYEGELELLLKACKRGHKVIEIPIISHYADGRPSSHFQPVRDTWLVCRTFLQEFFWK